LPPRDGALINDNGTVYIISDEHRYGFTSKEVFLGLGYSFAHVIPGDTSFLTTLEPINSAQIPHPPGTVIDDNGTICVIESRFKLLPVYSSGGRLCFTNFEEFKTWGFQPKDIIPANELDKSLPITRFIRGRTANSWINP
ncbi:MAG TPA: hypothetical protein VD998_01735, partial [Verrucomicrobiae bacterium]|nr:hypothetical protein [Verrucomicrobiae bacterium]